MANLSPCAELIIRWVGLHGEPSDSWLVWGAVPQAVRSFYSLGSVCAARKELLSLGMIEEDWCPDDTGKEPVFVFRLTDAGKAVQHG